MEQTKRPAFYTVDQLMQLANTGACAVPQEDNNDGVCADKTQAAFADPSTFKIPGTKRMRFTLRNNDANAIYFGFGESLSKPGLSALYPNSVFNGKEGVNFADFFAGDSLIPVGSAPNSLATQSECQRNPRQVISRIAIVRVDESDPILANNMQFERINPSNGKANTEEVSPECSACTGSSNSKLITAAFQLGLAPADERNALGILIPGKVGQTATDYTIDVDLAFTEGAYGYIAVAGGTLTK